MQENKKASTDGFSYDDVKRIALFITGAAGGIFVIFWPWILDIPW